MSIMMRVKIKEGWERFVVLFGIAIACLLSLLCVSMFVSNFLSMVFFGGVLGYASTWLVIYLCRKYHLTWFSLSCLKNVSRQIYLVGAFGWLGYAWMAIEINVFAWTVVYASFSLVFLFVALFAKVDKAELEEKNAKCFFSEESVWMLAIMMSVGIFVLSFLVNGLGEF